METGPCAPTTVTHLSGEKFSIRIRSHEIIVDQTIAGGGDDSAPTPLELLGASLGSCIAFYVRRFLHARGLPDDVSVDVSHSRAQNPSRIDEFLVNVRLPAGVPGHYMQLVERVLATCPAHNTLAMGAKIGVTFLEPAAV